MHGRAAHERPTDASSRAAARAPGRFRRDRARGRDSASRARGAAASTARRNRDARERIGALVPRRAPPRVSGPLEHEPRGDERSGSAPHELVGLVRDVLRGRARGARRRVPGSVRQPKRDEQNPRLARQECRLALARATVRPPPKSGFAACRSSVRERDIARDPISFLHGRDRRRSSSAQMTPAAPQYSVFSGLVARHRSQSSARHRSFGPRNAASVSSTISRMPARIRSSSQGSSVSGSKSSGR